MGILIVCYIEHTIMQTKKSAFGKDGMFRQAHPIIFRNAALLRKRMTPAETILWNNLKASFPTIKFRRQHPIGNFILDFYCHKKKLVIEVDGTVHNDIDIMEKDRLKESFLLEEGLSLIRFSNEQVLKNPEQVLKLIADNLDILP